MRATWGSRTTIWLWSCAAVLGGWALLSPSTLRAADTDNWADGWTYFDAINEANDEAAAPDAADTMSCSFGVVHYGSPCDCMLAPSKDAEFIGECVNPFGDDIEFLTDFAKPGKGAFDNFADDLPVLKRGCTCFPHVVACGPCGTYSCHGDGGHTKLCEKCGTLKCSTPQHVDVCAPCGTKKCSDAAHVTVCVKCKTFKCSKLSHTPDCGPCGTYMCSLISHMIHCDKCATLKCDTPQHKPLCGPCGTNKCSIPQHTIGCEPCGTNKCATDPHKVRCTPCKTYNCSVTEHIYYKCKTENCTNPMYTYCMRETHSCTRPPWQE